MAGRQMAEKCWEKKTPSETSERREQDMGKTEIDGAALQRHDAVGWLPPELLRGRARAGLRRGVDVRRRKVWRTASASGCAFGW